MQHFSCDICGKTLNPTSDLRYRVRMEVNVATEPGPLPVGDLDQDHLDEMAIMLEELEAGDTKLDLVPVSKTMEFDLCGTCHRKFLANPLGRDIIQKAQFSSN